MATSCGAFARRLAAVLAVAVVGVGLLAAPAWAAQDEPRLTGSKAIAIAASDPAVGPLIKAVPGSHWEAVYDEERGTWSVVLEPKGAHTVLAEFTIRDRDGAVTARDVASTELGPPRLDADEAIRLARREPEVRDWIAQYDDVRDSATLGDDRLWTVRFYDGAARIAEVRIADGRMEVTDVRTGPQVDWQQARGLPDSYGRLINEWWIFLPMALLFVAGLVDWRRPFSLRTLDLVAMVALGVSLIWFNRGDLFVATPLVYPVLAYLFARMVAIGFGRQPRSSPVGQTHMLVLVALTCALIGFRLGLNNQNSNILDVGYASVVGADRLTDGRIPYGTMPTSAGEPCGGYRSNGDPVGRVQVTSGRCESPVSSGDTYGPVVYAVYVPFVWIFGWSGLWDQLPAAHVAASAFDLAAIVGLLVAGWRLGSRRLGVLLAFGWAANPFTLYALNMNTNDALVGALVAWMMALLALPLARGVMLGLAALSKLGPLCLVPLVLSLRGRLRCLAGFGIGVVAVGWLVFLDGLNGPEVFWDRTLGYQIGRVTPLSIWTIGDFHPGWPDLGWLQQATQVAVAVFLLALAVFPRHGRDAAAVAALAGAAVIATQAVSSYWFYPYVCWWLPLVLLGVLLPREGIRIREA